MLCGSLGSSHNCEVTHPLCWGPCVSIGKKRENQFFPVHLPPSASSHFSGQRESPTPAMSQPLALSAVTHGHTARGVWASPPCSLSSQLMALCLRSELFVSPEVSAMQDLPLASESASPADSSFFHFFFPPLPLSNVLLCCSSFPSLSFSTSCGCW